jgi:prepilin-type N-terminal cleavage/methylation domain-containing protein
MMRIMGRFRGFTLIELLIVVGIISILAMIALPNFLMAQTRAKVAAVQSDLRVIVGSLEMYQTDYNHYPSGDTYPSVVSTRLIPLTTPISYMTSVPRDRFLPREAWNVGLISDPSFDTYDYVNADVVPTRGSGISSGGAYRVCSSGPDLYQAYGGRPVENRDANELGVDYDPTNGVISIGDIVRVGALHTRFGDPLNQANPNRPGIVRVPNYIEQWR